MEKTALLISDQLQDLNRMKNWFPKGITVKGVNAFSAVPAALRSELPTLIIIRVREFDDFFSAYEAIRTTPVTENVPIIAIADLAIGDALKENVDLKGTTLMGSSVTDGYMMRIIGDAMGIHNKE